MLTNPRRRRVGPNARGAARMNGVPRHTTLVSASRTSGARRAYATTLPPWLCATTCSEAVGSACPSARRRSARAAPPASLAAWVLRPLHSNEVRSAVPANAFATVVASGESCRVQRAPRANVPWTKTMTCWWLRALRLACSSVAILWACVCLPSDAHYLINDIVTLIRKRWPMGREWSAPQPGHQSCGDRCEKPTPSPGGCQARAGARSRAGARRQGWPAGSP